MSAVYIKPLSNAWDRMKVSLFKQFDIGKWFILGVSAFLAGLTDGPYGSGGTQTFKNIDNDFHDLAAFPPMAWNWLMDHQGWFTLIIIGIMAVLGLLFLLTWLSSRGKFMFLDNIVHDRAEVVEPWNKFKKLGNSLFLWRVCFGFICAMIFITYFVFCLIIAFDIYDGSLSLEVPVIFLVGMGLTGLLLIIICEYIELFLTDFVVPLMYKNNINTNQAWTRFLPLLSKNTFSFFLYGLFIFILHIGVSIVVVVVWLCTCCIGFLLFIIPYIQSVITLPITYLFRSLSLEFLGQFGPKYKIFPKAAPVLTEKNG